MVSSDGNDKFDEIWTSTNHTIRILSPYRKGNHPIWLRNVEIYEPLANEIARDWLRRLSPARLILREFLWAWRLFLISKRYDLILTGSDRVGLLLGVMQLIIRRRRTPHIYLDFLINLNQESRLERTFRRHFYQLALIGASSALVQRSCEVDAYSNALRLPPSKFCFVPYHSTVFETKLNIRDDGFIFAGGDSDRDYALLVRAVTGLSYKVVIAALQRDHFTSLLIPNNVEIVTVNAVEFLDLVARARLIVVPLKALPQHVGGEQTYINAMTVGKPTIVTDLNANDYIENNVTGILTPAGNVDALRESIIKVMQNHDFALSLGRNAKQASAKFTPEKFFRAVFRLAEGYVAALHTPSSHS